MEKIVLIAVVCLSMVPMAMSQNVFIVTEQGQLEAEGAGFLGDYLRSQGYQVTVDGDETQGVSYYQGSLTNEKIAYLESFDVVIVHRSISSGSYNGAGIIDQWNQLKVPLLNGSAYLARNTRWFWVDAAQKRTVDFEVEIKVPDHPIVKGLTGEFFSIPLGIDHVAEGDVGEGTVIATLPGTNDPAIIVWEPNQAFTATGKQKHTDPRVFLPIYRYHETPENAGGSYATDPADGAYTDYTPNGLKLIKQAIDYLHSFNAGTDVHNWELH